MNERTYPYPMIRVSTFGRFVVECLSAVPAQGTARPEYVRVEDEEWGGRNHGRNLLKLLVCSDCRCAPRDVLLELLWPDAEKRHADRYLNSAAWVLRRVLRTLGESSLLRTLRPSNDLTIYELADQEQLWVDADAFLDLLSEAERAERAGQDPLPWLEKAQELAQGEFLVEDLYHAWADQLRQSVNAARHRCLHWLADLYEQRGMLGRAETLLYTTLKQDPADEDVLYRLMRVLARQGRAREALACYERTKRVLLREQQVQPLARTRELAEQIRDEAVVVEHGVRATHEATGTIVFLPTKIESLSEDTNLKPSLFEINVPSSPLVQNPYQWSIGELLEHIEPAIREHLLAEERRQGEKKLSRRQIISLLISVSAAVFGIAQTGDVPLLHESEILSLCNINVPLAWQLYFAGGIKEVAQALPGYIFPLTALAQPPSKYQQLAATLTSQAYQLDWLLALQKQNFGKALDSIKQSFRYSEIADDNNLRASSLIRQAHIFFHLKRPIQQMQLHRQAMQYSNDISPLLQGWLYIVMAESHARLRQSDEARRFLGLAYDTFPEHPENDPNFSYVPVNHFTLANHAALAYLHLRQPKLAWDTLAQIDKEIPTALVPKRVELLNRQTAVSFALGDMDQTCSYFELAAVSARELGSDLRYNEVCEIYEQMQIMWPHESRMNALEELLH